MNFKSEVVTHHNYINESKFENFTELELNLFIVILYKMRKEKNNEVIFNSDEIKGMTSSKHRGYKTFTTIIEGLQDRTVYLKTEKGYDRIKPFPTLSFNIKNKEVKVEINKNIVPLIKELNQQFTQYSLREFLSLNSKYGKRIYQMLKQYESIGKRTVQLSDLREYLDCTNKSYDKMSNLDKKVLAKAKDDINSNTSLKIDYKKNKAGRSVKSIEFSISERKEDTYSHNYKEILEAEIIEVKPTKEKVKFSKKTYEKQEIKIEEDTYSHKIEEAILKAKKNIYVSKAWNKRVDNKIRKILKDQDEPYTIDILKRLYEGIKQEIKSTLVQYINGIIKNVQSEVEDNKSKQKKISELIVKEVTVSKAKEETTLKKTYMSIDEFNRLDDEKKKELEEKAIKIASKEESIPEKFLLNLKSKSFSIYFNAINKYMEIL